MRNYYRLLNEGYIDFISVADIDVSKKNLADRFGIPFYKDYIKMISKCDLDAVSIAVPTKLHYEVSVNVFKYGVNALIEKPITYDLDSAYKLAEEAKRYNVKVMVGHIERFNPAVSKVRELMEDGILGEILALDAKRLGGPRLRECGVILDLAIHDIDVFKYLLSKKPKFIYASACKKIPETNGEDYAVITLKFDSDVIGRIEVSRVTPAKIRELSVTGMKSYVRMNYISQDVELIENFLMVKRASWRDFQEFISKFRPRRMKIEVVKEEPLYIELRSFIEALEKNSEMPVSIYDAIDTLKIVYKAVESYKLNRVVSL